MSDLASPSSSPLPGAQEPGIACPGCGQRMRAVTLDRKPLGTVVVDLCATCQAVWFDTFESLQLTPGSVVTLFATINDLRPKERRPLPSRLPCPRCSAPLELTHDQTNLAHFSYYRCPFRHGRLTPFFQFLREKSFIRPLAPADLERLKAHIRVIHCSSCGAPVDLARETTCTYCHAPISVLDPDAVQKALADYRAQETARRTIDPVALVDSVLQARAADDATRAVPATAVDLVALGLDVLHDLLGHALP